MDYKPFGKTNLNSDIFLLPSIWENLNPPGQPAWDIRELYRLILIEGREIEKIEQPEVGILAIHFKNCRHPYYLGPKDHPFMNSEFVTRSRFKIKVHKINAPVYHIDSVDKSPLSATKSRVFNVTDKHQENK